MPTHFKYLKSLEGTIPGYVGTCGTFIVHLPAISATSYNYSTMVTIAGVLATDIFQCQLQNGATAASNVGSTARILHMARATDGGADLWFVNIGAATGYTEYICSYTVTRPPS